MDKRPIVLVTAVGAPPGLNTLRVLIESGRFRLVAADASRHSAGLYHFDCTRVVLPTAENTAAYIEALEGCVRDYGADVIIPCVEEEVMCIADAAANHPLLGERTLIPSGYAVRTVSNKWHATKQCMDLGLPCPETQLVPAGVPHKERVHIIDEFERRCPMPWIIKPTIAHGMRGVEKIEVLSQAYKYLMERNDELVVQEFIPGAVGSMFLTGMIYDRSGAVVRSFSSRSIRTLFSDGGPATAGISVEPGAFLRDTQRLIDALGGWVGPMCAEWMLDPRDHQFKFIEINPRLWGYSYLTKVAGSPFAECVADLSLDAKIGVDKGYKVGAVLLRSTVDLGWEESPFLIEI